MARKHQLRKQRAGTVINVTSKKQESDVITALRQVEERLNRKFGKKGSSQLSVERWPELTA